MKYYYETLSQQMSPLWVLANNDEEALAILRARYGEKLVSVIIVYVEDSHDHRRTVWMA